MTAYDINFIQKFPVLIVLRRYVVIAISKNNTGQT